MRSAERTLENRCEISSTDRPRHSVRMLSNSSCSARRPGPRSELVGAGVDGRSPDGPDVADPLVAAMPTFSPTRATISPAPISMDTPVTAGVVALGLGHAVAEPEQQLAALGHGDQQGHGRGQDQRHQPRLEGDQGKGRPDQPVVEGRGVVGLRLDRAGDVDDLGLGVPGGRLGQDLAVLPPDADRNPSPAMTTVSTSSLGRTVLAPAQLRPAPQRPVDPAATRRCRPR
jgi:hypothetical protein